jgi:hypothetical protein
MRVGRDPKSALQTATTTTAAGPKTELVKLVVDKLLDKDPLSLSASQIRLETTRAQLLT